MFRRASSNPAISAEPVSLLALLFIIPNYPVLILLSEGNNMEFMNAYKHLEKLCGDLLNDERRISAYIDEMAKISDGTSKVYNWDNDLKKLKHYRWIRNQIVHEPDCQEENMYHPDDVAWLNNFYSRIMNQTDPLALYLKSSKVNPLTKTQKESNYSPQRKKIHHKTKRSANFTLFFIILIVLIFVLLIATFLFQK